MTARAARRTGETRVSRRAFVVGSAAALLAPAAARAQDTSKVYRIAYVNSGFAAYHAGFEQALRERGWVSGRNAVFIFRHAEGKFDRLPALAAEVVRLAPDVICAFPTASAKAVKSATSTIPIVMWGVADPIGEGLIASFARPGGNVTGITGSASVETYAKQLQLLKEAVPRARRIALLWNPVNPAAHTPVKALEEAAGPLGVELQLVSAQATDELEPRFQAMAQARADALFIYAGYDRVLRRIADLALRQRLPTLCPDEGYAKAGGLINYSLNRLEAFRQVASYVDRILHGALPADLPVEQQAKFEIVINLKTAKALGLTIPPPVLARADQVIE